ncbi:MULTISPECIES: glycosyl hydrolase-related protein [unclassified Flavobacterium]|jgi:alpha-mannosidase|uniref:glycosyl hydrolase-related protein n=1 Tax=unclassified Flavobacterium TaxID=196869 RepID=UPI0025C08BF4|nr:MULTISPECIES: glycosyl hydrolase-related protein [unclassified Flavobacterium]
MPSKLILYFLLVIIMPGELFAQQKRLYIANDDHTDYMWTANEAKYDSAFVKMLDYSLLQIDSTKNFPSNFQARFNCDGSLWLKKYQKYRSDKQFNRLIAAIKSGHISSPLNMLVNCYGAQPTEAVIRGMYYAGQLERQYNLRFTMAGAMENNTLPLGLASLWAGSGAKYSWKGIGGYGSQLSYEIREKRPHQMYRYNGLDGNGVLMKWYNYNEKTTAPLGSYAECRLNVKYKKLDDDFKHIVNALDKYCDTISPNSTYPYNIAGAFGFGHDDLDTYVSNAYINAAKKGTNNERSVRVSNEEDFFIDFEKYYPKVPAQSVSFGNEWDLLPASMNETTARMRRATEKMRSAEALATLVSLKDKNFMKETQNARDKAWESYGMYWEHNWTADGPVSRKARADWQIKTQENLTAYVDTLLNLSIKKMGSHIKVDGDPSFFVFNPLSWIRNDIADLEYNGAYPVKVIDKVSGKEVTSQLITKSGKQFLRIFAPNIPSVGYKVFLIKKGFPKVKPIAATVQNEYISNDFYRLRFSKSGVITEITDKLANRQLIKITDRKDANDLGANDVNDGEEITVENAGPVSVTLKAVSSNPVLHTTRITLYADSPRIDIEDNIQQNFGDVKTWSFSFDLNDPTTRHEELGAILTDKLEKNGGHYANSIARYDWQTFNHFANLSEKNYGITLSNLDCSFFKLGNSTINSLDERSSQINALAGGNVDKKVEDVGILGILNQNGNKDFLYHFAISTNKVNFDPTTSMKFSLEHQNPLVTGMITGGENDVKLNTFSLLVSNNPNILLWSVKPSEEGIENGIITRFWNFSNISVQPKIQFNAQLKSAFQTSHIETNKKEIEVAKSEIQFGFKPFQILTFRAVLENK